jgi:hypothetical protein
MRCKAPEAAKLGPECCHQHPVTVVNRSGVTGEIGMSTAGDERDENEAVGGNARLGSY